MSTAKTAASSDSSERMEERLQEALLPEPLHSHHRNADRTEENADDEVAARAKLLWWKRPSAYWLYVALPFHAMSTGATLAPRIEIYRQVACDVYMPDYNQVVTTPSFGLPYGNQSIALNFETTPRVFEDAEDYVFVEFIDDGERDKRCASHPKVQVEVARLTTAMTATEGVLSCITTAWWGSFSDRYGRTRVMGLSVIGFMTTAFMFISVSHLSHYLPGGYWFIILGPVMEGSFGGITSVVAAMQAYISDITSAGARAGAFSIFLGLQWVGMALGPTMGGVLISVTNNILSVFYLSIVLHMVYAILVWFFIPESLHKNQMIASRLRHKEELNTLKVSREGVAAGFTVRFKRAFEFLSPLALFVPPRVEEEHPVRGWKRDWNLTFVAAAYGLVVLIISIYPYTFIYATTKFGWSTSTLAYFLSVVLVARATYLTVLLPLGIKLFKPKPSAIQLPLSDSSPLPSTTSSDEENHNPVFDLQLARVSLFVEVIQHTLMGLAPNSITFSLATLMGSVGQGFIPSVQSVALELYSRRGETETGKLFGALSVVSALGSQIVGPAMFGFVYIQTVAFAPAAVFYVSTAITAVALTLLCLVRLGDVRRDVEEQVVLVDVDT